MYSLENVSPLHRAKLEIANRDYNLHLNPLAERYGINFVLTLLYHLTRKRKKQPLDNRIPLVPTKREESIQQKIFATTDAKKKTRLYNRQSELHTEYYNLLKEAGFTFFEWNEDFVDEDTGEVVTVPREEIYLLIKKQTPT